MSSDDTTTIVAAGPRVGSVTNTATSPNGIYWSENVLKQIAMELDENEVSVQLRDEPGAGSLVGEVTSAEFDEEKGYVFEMEIHDDEVARKISGGLIEPSPRVFHETIERTEEPVELEDPQVDAVFLYSQLVDDVLGTMDTDRTIPMAEYIETHK